MNPQRFRIRWRDGIAFIGNTVIGTVSQSPSGGVWLARGCFIEWEDVDLGFTATEAAAKQRVDEWYHDHDETP